jgi:hypothetical protein
VTTVGLGFGGDIRVYSSLRCVGKAGDHGGGLVITWLRFKEPLWEGINFESASALSGRYSRSSTIIQVVSIHQRQRYIRQHSPLPSPN